MGAFELLVQTEQPPGPVKASVRTGGTGGNPTSVQRPPQRDHD
jgi:hypothetical protein